MELSKVARLVSCTGMVIASSGISAARATGSASEILGSVTAPMDYAPATTAGTAEFSVLLWAPLLLVTVGCIVWLLWLIVVDTRKHRAAAETTAIEPTGVAERIGTRLGESTIQAGCANDELEELVATRMELQKMRQRLLCDFGGEPVSGG